MAPALAEPMDANWGWTQRGIRSSLARNGPFVPTLGQPVGKGSQGPRGHHRRPAGDRRLGAIRDGRCTRGDRHALAPTGRGHPGAALIHPRIVSLSREPFRCGNDIPVTPDLAIEDVSKADILILPELWLAPSDDMRERDVELKDSIRQLYRGGCTVYSACSGSVLRRPPASSRAVKRPRIGPTPISSAELPEVRFNPEPNLVFADPAGRIVTAGGTTSWHDLAIHIISRHCGPGEALRIAKVYLLKLHGEGQLPYASLVRRQPHADSVVRHAETWLAENFREPHAVAAAVAACGVPERRIFSSAGSRRRRERH